MSGRISEHLRGNAVGYLALFVALSGTAWAAHRIGAGDIKRNAVRTRHIKNGQVKTADLGAGAVTGAKVADGSLTGAKVADGSLTGADVGADSLGGAQIDESKLFTSTRVISPGATPAESGQRLQDTLAALPLGELWLLKLEPGVYEVSAPLHIRDNIKIEGSGPLSTEIISSAGGPTVLSAVGRVTNVSDLTINSGPGETAILATSGILLLDNVSVFSHGSTAFVFGIHAAGGLVHVHDSTIDVSATGPGASAAGAQTEAGSLIAIRDSEVSATADSSGGVATALAAKDTTTAKGSNLDGTGLGAAQGFGVVASGSNALAQIDESTINGSTDAVGAAGSNKVQVGASKVVGGSNVAAPNVTCVFSYKADYTPVVSTTCN